MRKKKRIYIFVIVFFLIFILLFKLDNPLLIASKNGVFFDDVYVTNQYNSKINSASQDEFLIFKLNYRVGFTGNSVNISWWVLDLDTNKIIRTAYSSQEKNFKISNPNSGVSTSMGYLMPNKKLTTEVFLTSNDIIIGSKQLNISLIGEQILCINGEKRCLDKYPLICEEGIWFSQGMKIGFCGVECLKNSDCGINTCEIEYNCKSNKCQQFIKTIPQKPCVQAFWEEPTCSWNISNCVPEPPKPEPISIQQIIQKIIDFLKSIFGI